MIKVYPLRVCGKGIFINYTYLLVNETNLEALLIDPGWEYDVITHHIFKTKCSLKGVLLTHHHFDHTQLASKFARSFNVPVFISSIERSFYNFDCFKLVDVDPDNIFAIGSFHVFPYLTPGHTRGSVCYKIDNNLFTGDTLFIEGCGACSGEEAAIEMFNSFKKLKFNITPTTIIFPGHSYGIDPGVTFRYLSTQNIYCHFNTVNDFIAFRLRRNQRGLFNFK